MAEQKLWSDKPAGTGLEGWNRAYPLGNGRLGAMVHGNPGCELLQLNEESVWAGPPVTENREGAFRCLSRARALCRAGQYEACDALVQQRFMGERRHPRSYQTLCDLRMILDDGETENYRRELSLETGMARTVYTSGGSIVTRETFVSFADDCLLLRLTADGPGTLNASVSLSRAADAVSRARGNRLFLSGRARHGETHPGVSFSVCAGIKTDGELNAADGALAIRSAHEIVLCLCAYTDYHAEDPANPLTADLERQSEAAVELALQKGYEACRTAHLAQYGREFHTCSLRLGRKDDLDAEIPTEQLLRRVREGGKSLWLEHVYFAFGRYLLLCSSRRCRLPANLQGIWNRDLEAVWNSDYHLNINLQMNYWPALPAHLEPCMEPYFRFLEGLCENGRVTARRVFGCRGVFFPHATDVWRYTAPKGEVQAGMWVTAAAWCCRDFAEYVRYTGDREFCRGRALPILREVCLFLLDWLTPDPETGELVSGPCTSPENRFETPDGGVARLTMGPAMDQQIAEDIFSAYEELAELAAPEDELLSSVREARGKLKRPAVGPDGRIEEWGAPLREAEPGHRHISHLYGLYPARLYTFEKTPGCMKAAEKTLARRLEAGGGYTGWSRAWIVNFYARLRRGNDAEEQLRLLLARSTSGNLFDQHPPFQIDGNLGAVSGICELLLQNTDDALLLLPALPDVWEEGEALGLRAWGGLTVDLRWRKGRLTEAALTAPIGYEGELRYRTHTARVRLRAGERCLLGGSLERMEEGQ